MRTFTYTRPSSLSEATRAVAAGGGATRFLAGGTTLYDLMLLNVEAPDALVDVTYLPELSEIEVGQQELVFGALARMSDVAEHAELKSDYPLLSESLWKAASQQLRTMATVGGNLLQRTRCAYFRGGEPYSCNKRQPGSGCSAIGGLDRPLAILGTSDSCIANYPGDWAVALVAMNASIDVVGLNGTRNIPLHQLHREPGSTPHIETVLTPGEFITHIRVPAGRIGRASTYHKIRDRESYAFALTSAAVALDIDGGLVREARIAVGGVASRPWRVTAAERLLQGKPLTSENALAAGYEALSGSRAGVQNGFKIELGARTVADALMIAGERV